MTAGRTPRPEVLVARRRTATLQPIPAEYDRLEPLYEIQNLLTQPIAIEQSCDALLPIVTRVLRVRTAVLIDTTQELTRTLLWAAAGIVPADLEEAREHARNRLVDLSHRGIRLANIVRRDAVLPGSVAEQEVASRHFVTLPLAVDRHVFGVFQLEGANAFAERDLLFINAVANQIAITLHQQHVQLLLATSRSELELANRRLQDVQTISAAALEGPTLDASMSAVLHALRAIFATPAAAVLRTSPDGKTLRVQASLGLEGADLDDLVDVSPIVRANGLRSKLGAPMHARNRLSGVLCVASREHRAFTDDEMKFLELVANRLGTIIDNASLYEQAQAAIRARDAVMGLVSHDLRNPLSAIQMCSELLATDAPQLAKPVSIIKRSVDIMVRLIGDLRDVGSIEAGHLSIQCRSEDARALVRDAIEGVQDDAAKKQLRFEMQLPEAALGIYCDRIRVIQVLTNLLSNAIKFTPPGGSITISMQDGEPDQARVSVEDTGCGIPEADLPYVFDRYWQADGTAHLGTGLGLTITKGIVDAHGGAISVESHVGRGTKFSFTLPLAARLAVPSERAQSVITQRTLDAWHR